MQGDQAADPGFYLFVSITYLLSSVVLPASASAVESQGGLASLAEVNVVTLVLQGTPFATGITDSQSWIRSNAIAPDWERIGADLISPSAAYNAAFTVWA